MSDSDFLVIYAKIGMDDNLVSSNVPLTDVIVNSKITKLMVLAQGIFYAKHGKKLFDDSFLDDKNKKEIDRIYLEFIKSYKGEIQEPASDYFDSETGEFLSKLVKNYKHVSINDLDIELRRVYDFEYLNKQEKQSLQFEIDNNIFTYIDIIPVVFQLRYKRIEYRTAINNIFWR
ncbi:MAG: hypothetical protein ACO3UL_08365 [Flavobacteriaceae bacterium]